MSERIELSTLHELCRQTALSPGSGFIYGLVDPRRVGIAYVGQSTRPLIRRYLEHLNGDGAQGTSPWVAELAAAGLYPELVILERPSTELLNARETAWTAELQARGEAWLNQKRLLPGEAALRAMGRVHARALAEDARWEAHRRSDRDLEERQARLRANRRRGRNVALLGIRSYERAR